MAKTPMSTGMLLGSTCPIMGGPVLKLNVVAVGLVLKPFWLRATLLLNGGLRTPGG